MAKRQYNNNPEYTKWRRAVRKRDGARCQMPRCRARTRIQVHHIIQWAISPALRYVVSNGICLCRKCHASIRGQEGIWAPLFQSIVNNK